MLSYAFGYYIGQNIAWLFSSWVISMLVCAVLPAIIFIADSHNGVRALTVFVGWASVAFISEFVLKIGHSTFDGDTKNQLLPLVATLDAFVFLLITFITNVNDASPVIWIILLGTHVIYVWGIWHFNNYAKRVHDHRTYFSTYIFVLVANDVFFFIIALIVHGHPLNFIAVLIAGALTAAGLLLSTRSDMVMQWLSVRPEEN